MAFMLRSRLTAHFALHTQSPNRQNRQLWQLHPTSICGENGENFSAKFPQSAAARGCILHSV
ncbi:MAG: hypothetical protein OJF49_002818 [Ktedonobacterales bacterium]|nr:MAG: hypothetical protein OJF49_002818 [Ktedonobacterales bacterium]